MEKKIIVTITAEFYPAENEEFTNNHGHLSDAEQLDLLRNHITDKFENEAMNGLWSHLADSKVEYN